MFNKCQLSSQMENNCILYRILSRPCYGLSFVSVHKCSIVIVCKCPSVFASVFSLFKCVFSVDQCLCVHQCLQMFMKAYQSFKVFLSFKSVYSLYNCLSVFISVFRCQPVFLMLQYPERHLITSALENNCLQCVR